MYIIHEAMSIAQAKKIFGIDSVPSLDDLKDLHKKLVMKHHPDRGGDLSTMQNVNAAFDILKKNTGSSRSNSRYSAPNWDEIYAKNKIKFGLMRDFFSKTYDSEKIKSYLENIFGAPLTVGMTDNTPKEFFKGEGISDRQFSNFYNASIHLYTEDKKTYFTVDYSISDNTPSPGALGSSEIDERDIMYNISVFTTFYYNKKNLKLSQNRYNYKYNIGIKKLLDPKELFPEAKIKKAMGSSSKKLFKKSDMLLGLKRELGASINDNTIFIYPLGKLENTFLGFHFTILRNTFMKKASYMVGGIKYVNNGKMTVYRTPTFSVFENEEDFELFVQNVKDSVKEVEKKKLSMLEDGEKIAKIFSDNFEQLKKIIYKKYDL